jgi:hypothetical protein
MGKDSWRLIMSEIALKYLFAKDIVIIEGYQDEILWQSSLCFNNIDESMFLRELAWVILSSGMREKVIHGLFANISNCFYNWNSSEIIVANKYECYHSALRYFNNTLKIQAIINAAIRVQAIGFYELKISIRRDPIRTLRQFSYIGPITVYHLAKNIGLPFAKPDRHLTRIANAEGFEDVQAFCKHISESTGDSVPVVDIVLWRFATLDKNYIYFFGKKE